MQIDFCVSKHSRLLLSVGLCALLQVQRKPLSGKRIDPHFVALTYFTVSQRDCGMS